MEAGSNQVEVQVDEAVKAEPILDSLGRARGIGRRKSSVARVLIKKGSGSVIVNGREVANHFKVERHRQDLCLALKVIDMLASFDVVCRVRGGGVTGQSGAIRLGIARALVNYNPLYRKPLRDAGLLTCDSRRVESKKYGRKKARRRFQFAKR